MSPRPRRAAFNVTPTADRPPPRIVGEIVLVFCSVCGKFIAHEDGHMCVMSPEYRALRKAARDEKTSRLREWQRFERDENVRGRRTL